MTATTGYSPSDLMDGLQAALRAEHTGIILVLAQAYRLTDSALASRLEGLSRQQMRHFKWLAEHIVDCGGVPTLEKEPLAALPDGAKMGFNVVSAAFEALITCYDAWQVGPEATRRLIARILSDKRVLHAKLARIESAWQSDAAPAAPSTVLPGANVGAPDQVRSLLEFAIGHEYEVILQYLHHAFLLKDQAGGRVLEDVAIDEMQHLGWLSEMLVERGGSPQWEAARLEYHDDAVRMLELDQARELEVVKQYHDMAIATDDAELKALFERIREHEDYHDGLLGNLIARLKSDSSAIPAPTQAKRCPYGFTIGGMLGMSQNQTGSDTPAIQAQDNRR